MKGRTALLWIDRGHGWQGLTPHGNAQAALESLSIDWGVDRPGEQPDPPVMHFTVRDLTGELAGDALNLAGAAVWLQMDDALTWARPDIPERWRDVHVPWADLAERSRRTSPAQPDSALLTVFRGRVTVGGSVEQRTERGWLVKLAASGLSVLLKRTTTQGPTSNDPMLAGRHWVGTPAERLEELQARFVSFGLMLTESTLAWLQANLPSSVVSYSSDSYPQYATILASLASQSSDMPMWYETHTRADPAPSLLMAALPGAAGLIAMDAKDGSLRLSHAGRVASPIPADRIMVDETMLSLPDPISQITLHGKRATWDEEKQQLDFEDTDVTYTSAGLLPANLTESQKSLSLDSDAVLRDDSAGHLNAPVYTASSAERSRRAAWLLVNSTKLIPNKLRVDSRKLMGAQWESLFVPAPGLPIVFIHNRYTSLRAHDGTPATSGGWLPIGGTLTYRHVANMPTWVNELNVQALPRPVDRKRLRWQDLTVHARWKRMVELTWDELGQIDLITTDITKEKTP